mmetsp:Transcript_2397/g.3553  ORF Transcript_2397/g.3553 Transcript_2397/m.3553 type:complete len:357 (+) Transcript_2397:291-1361(+)
MNPTAVQRMRHFKLSRNSDSRSFRSFGSFDEENKRRLAATTRHRISVKESPSSKFLFQSRTEGSFTNDFTYSDLEEIPGFFEPRLLDAYQLLNKTQLDHGVFGAVVEIGVYQGRSFIPLCFMRRRDDILGHYQEVAVAIDCFDFQEHNLDSSGRGDLREFQKNLKKQGLFIDKEVSNELGNEKIETRTSTRSSSIVAMRADSVALESSDILQEVRNLSSMIPNSSSFNDIDSQLVRLFSIDGCHTEDAVRSDIALAEQCLHEGGVILVDDALNPDWPGVASGLHQYMLESWNDNEKNPLYPFAFGYNKCFLARGDKWASLYRSSLQNLERKRAIFWNREVSILKQGFIAAHFGNDA